VWMCCCILERRCWRMEFACLEREGLAVFASVADARRVGNERDRNAAVHGLRDGSVRALFAFISVSSHRRSNGAVGTAGAWPFFSGTCSEYAAIAVRSMGLPRGHDG